MSKYLDRFKFFILHHSSFTKEEQEHILKSLDDDATQRRFKISLLLFSWTVVSFFIESFLIGGGFVLSLIHGIDWRYFLPELSFILLNFFGKFFYIRWYMKKRISVSHSIYASLPAVGPVIIFSILIRDNLLLMKAFRRYVRYLRKKIFSFRFSKKEPHITK